MSIEIALPEWLLALNRESRCFGDDGAAMDFVFEAVRRNIADGGGPFGAMVTDASGAMVAVGVNRVRPAGQSVLHGEVVALMLAQQKLGSHFLADDGAYTLFTSCAPCDMCCGAIRNAGIRRLVCGARSEDAEAAGFDEGIKPPDWASRINSRGIAVVEDLSRPEGAKLMQDYVDNGGELY